MKWNEIINKRGPKGYACSLI